MENLFYNAVASLSAGALVHAAAAVLAQQPEGIALHAWTLLLVGSALVGVSLVGTVLDWVDFKASSREWAAFKSALNRHAV